jgi:hypothetical protein
MTADGEEELMRGALLQRHAEPLSDGTSDGQFDGVRDGLRLGDLVVGESVGVHVALPAKPRVRT